MEITYDRIKMIADFVRANNMKFYLPRELAPALFGYV
jgi:hypothetical protein